MARRSSRRRLSGVRRATEVAQVVARPSLRSPVRVGSFQASAVVAVLAPQFQIAREADALRRDVGARLLEPEREAAEFPRERRGPARRRRRLAIARRCGSSKNCVAESSSSTSSSSLRGPAGKFAARAVTTTWPPFSRGMQLRDRGDGVFVVDVVEDQQPGRVRLQPAQAPPRSSPHPACRPSRRGRATSAPASAARSGVSSVAGIVGARRTAAPNSLASARRRIRSRAASCRPRRARAAPGPPPPRSASGRQRGAQCAERGTGASDEQVAEREQTAGCRAARVGAARRLHQRLEDRRTEDLRDEIVLVGERLREMVDRLQPREMLGLRGVGRREFRVAVLRRALARRSADPCCGAARATPPIAYRKSPRPPRSPDPAAAAAPRDARGRARNCCDAERPAASSRSSADEMHDRLAIRDILVEHAQRVAAERLEILLDFHFDVQAASAPCRRESR